MHKSVQNYALKCAIEKERVMHSDWGGPTLDKAVYLGFEVSPRNNPSDWSCVVFQ